jgi:hypothetical protein
MMSYNDRRLNGAVASHLTLNFYKNFHGAWSPKLAPAVAAAAAVVILHFYSL